MRILFIGDIFGKQGRKALADFLPKIIKKNNIDFVIANAENCTHGRSLNIKHYNYLKLLGVNFFTFGNHTWENDQIFDILEKPDTVRPYNIKPQCMESKYGVGSRVVVVKNKRIRITNMLGMSANCKNVQSNPFLAMDKLLTEIKGTHDIHIVDFHANATSEKNAYLITYAGQLSAILGTHTHVQTADEKIYNNTAYITDTGMNGPSNGIIGAAPKTIIQMFREQVLHFKLDPDTSKYQFNAVMITFNNKTNLPTSIKRINLVEG